MCRYNDSNLEIDVDLEMVSTNFCINDYTAYQNTQKMIKNKLAVIGIKDQRFLILYTNI